MFRDYIERGIIATSRPTATRLGGVTEWLAVAEIALAHHVPSCPPRGHDARAPAPRAGHAACPMIECIPWLQEIFAAPVDIRDGVFHVPDEPGASDHLDEGKFHEFRVA